MPIDADRLPSCFLVRWTCVPGNRACQVTASIMTGFAVLPRCLPVATTLARAATRAVVRGGEGHFQPNGRDQHFGASVCRWSSIGSS